MIALKDGAYAVADHIVEHEVKADLVARPLSDFPCLEHLLNGCQEPLTIGQHDVVELLTLRLRQLSALQGFQVEADGGDRCLQFMGDGIEKTIVALVSPHFPHQEDGIQDHAGDQQQEEGQANHQQDEAAPVDDDPADVEGDRDHHQASAKGNGKYHRISPSGDAHTGQALCQSITASLFARFSSLKGMGSYAAEIFKEERPHRSHIWFGTSCTN